jgi:hypothetical protein
MVREIISQEIISDPHLANKFYDRLRSHVHTNKTGVNRLK